MANLADDNRRLTAIIEALPAGTMLVDAAGHIVMVNAQLERIFGYSRDELIGASVEVLVPERARAAHAGFRAAFTVGPLLRRLGAGRDLCGRRKDGSEFPVEIGLNSIETDEGRGVVATIIDISDRKRAENAVQEGSELLQAILDNAPFPVMVTAPDQKVLIWNKAGERTFGFTPDEMVGLNFIKLLPDEDQRLATMDLGVSGGKSRFQGLRAECLHRDGSVRAVHLFNAPIFDNEGRIRAVVSILEDITQKNQIEEQLRQAQKMEAVGNLTGGMAHDFNNILGVIIGNLDLLREEKPDDASVLELTGEALDAAQRGADLTRRLLAFARRQPLESRPINVNDLVTDTMKLLRRVLGENIRVSIDLADDTHPIVGDSAQLEAALINLANNARDAMPDGGRLLITTANRLLDADYAADHLEVVAGNYVMIEVTDTGTGMPPEVAARIFEPFYTTKELGKGTGLGLSMVFGFFKQSGGHVSVYSEVGVGTTFRLYLPVALGVKGAEETATRPKNARGRGETILVVEDNPALRRIVVRQLTELGYRVQEACDPAEALTWFEEEGDINLLFTDVVMPGGIDGFQLARTARGRQPGLRVVLTSGFSEARLRSETERSDLKLLAKPYRKEELAQLIREVLDT